ncbi:MAG TPA: bacillithiol biosynthesis cysteine-adding enzyme BshC [Pyrinomonadaceae bacterium]|nr:bacillithiol biosynthesis cysteine-adding enzyme BshC [Pyrinomonadaceae bacterium]
MSTAETACHATPEQAGLRVEKLSFANIPGQSKLFLDYLRDPTALRRFYPEAVKNHFDLLERRERVLVNYETDRAAVCDALERMNRGWGASEQTLKHIQTLRESDCIAVVSGQQAGLFGGPLYTVYKALSAIKLAECLSLRGVKAVPVFWIATEDHDFAEVATAEFVNRDCGLSSVKVSESIHHEGSPVGLAVLDDSIDQTISGLLNALPQNEFSDHLTNLVRDCYRREKGFGDAFAAFLTRLTQDRGLILLDPLDAKLKKLAAPVYSQAAQRASAIAKAIADRSRELVEGGYHAQVTPSEDSFPLFLHDEAGARHALTRTANGSYRTKSESQKPDRQGGPLQQEYSAEELADLAQREPERFSPNVTLRAVVQDYLLPTIAYYGGSAEIAYFAQTSEVYRILDRPVTPILPRASLTFVEKHTWRSFERYGLALADFFEGSDHVIARVVQKYLGKETAQTFEHTTETFNKELDTLQEQLRRVDPTLADALDTGRRKINYQIDGLRTRFNRAQIARDEAVHRQLEHAFDLLYPNKALQERHINVTSFIARHGLYFIDWIFDAIELETNEHQIVYL